jgi:hypothetical protein
MMQSAEPPAASNRTRTVIAALGAIGPIGVLSVEAAIGANVDQLDYMLFGITLVSLQALDIDVRDIRNLLPGGRKTG